MFAVTKKSIRPNIDVKFFFELGIVPPEYTLYVNQTYISTGKLVHTVFYISDDRYELLTETNWVSRDEFLNYITDPICYKLFIQPSKIYEINHDIKSVISYKDNI